MGAGLLDLGEIMMTGAERRLDIASRNIANVSTPGYKAATPFATTLEHLSESTDLAQGGLSTTHRPFDLALSTHGFFAVRAGDQIYYTRDGQFTRAADGRLLNAQGMALQTDALADLVIRDPAATVAEDGAVLENNLPVAHVGVFAPPPDTPPRALGGGLFVDDAPAPMTAMQNPMVRQGALEASNVDTAAEMMHMMAAMREAEAGARVVQTYDGLIDQSITTFSKGQGS